MARMIAPLFAFAASPALAHPGLHPVPHGSGAGLIGVALVGALVAHVMSRVRG